MAVTQGTGPCNEGHQPLAALDTDIRPFLEG